jgi:hypothetical protein
MHSHGKLVGGRQFYHVPVLMDVPPTVSMTTRLAVDNENARRATKATLPRLAGNLPRIM